MLNGFNYPFGVAVSPDGTKIYVTNANGGNVSVIDTATNNVIATVNIVNVPIGYYIYYIAISPDGTKLYVDYNSRSTPITGYVSVIDTGTNTVTATVNVGDGTDSFAGIAGMAVTPDGSKVYVLNRTITTHETVSVIDTATNTIIANVPIGINSAAVAITPDGTKAYVANEHSNSVSVINTTNNIVTSTVTVGNSPFGVAVSPDGTRAYVTTNIRRAPGNVSVIDTATNTVIDTVPVGLLGSSLHGVAVSPDGTNVYVANTLTSSVATDSIYVINTTNNTVYASIPEDGYDPIGIAVTPDSSKVYVANLGIYNPGSVSVIDTATNTLNSTIFLEGTNLYAFPDVAVAPDGLTVYVTGYSQTVGNVYAINTTNNNDYTIINTGFKSPYGLAVTPDGKNVYVSNSGNNNVSVINTTTNTVSTISGFYQPRSIGQFIGTIPI